LKLLGLVESGGEANTRITNSEVIVNGSIDSRKRRKLVVGDKVKMDEYSVKIV
jgi:ribosome-associated protein